MKNSEYSMAINWHYIAVGLIFAAAVLLMVLYVPATQEFDAGIIKAVKGFSIPYFE